MKKMKNLLLVALFAICAFVVGGNVVEAAATINNFAVVCQASELGKNGETDCYLIGNLQNDTATGAGLHGIVAKTTVGNLDIVKFESAFDNVVAEKLNNGQSSTVVSGLQNGQSYTCKTDNGSPCYLLITKTAGNGLIAHGKSKKTASNSDYTVLGSSTVKVNENASVNDCGTLCVNATYALTDSEYTTGLHSSNTTESVCDEITVKEGEVATGNFVSYAVLAAGAFIAISAIALAKKHNKFYRV